MLAVFPQLLFLAPLSVTLIRVAVGITYLYGAYRIFRDAHAFTEVDFPIIGHAPKWLVYAGAVLSATIGCLLFVGAWTQPLAILAALGALKLALGRHFSGPTFPLSVAAAILLFVMSFSLIFSGAGAFAFDWPL